MSEDLREMIYTIRRIYNLHEHWSKSYDKDEMYRALGYVKVEDWLQALQIAISKLELLEKVEEIMPKKKMYQEENPSELKMWDNGYNQAVDLCTAIVAKKLEGLENIIEPILKQGLEDDQLCKAHENWAGKEYAKELALAIRQHFLGKE